MARRLAAAIALVCLVCCNATHSDMLDAFEHVEWVIENVRKCDKALSRSLHCVDLFGGAGGFAKTFVNWGKKSMLFDIEQSKDMNILTKVGFRNALQNVCRVKKGGFMPAGPPCSLFVWMSSSIHKRTPDNPEGNDEDLRVYASNLVAFNTLVLLVVAAVRGVYMMVEQPMTTYMFRLHRFARFIERYLQRTFTWLGSFGHPSPKLSILYSDLPGFDVKIARKKSAKKANSRMVCFSKPGWIHGGPEMKSSAAYPPRFVQAVAKVWLKAKTPKLPAPRPRAYREALLHVKG